jgi:hypothetical protein
LKAFLFDAPGMARSACPHVDAIPIDPTASIESRQSLGAFQGWKQSVFNSNFFVFSLNIFLFEPQLPDFFVDA